MALLTSAGLVEVQENGALFMPQMEDMTGSETERAAIMRKYRTPKTEKENHSEDSDREIEVQSSNHNVITMLPEPNHNVITSLPETDHIVDTEIEKELESELESETEPEKSQMQIQSHCYIQRETALRKQGQRRLRRQGKGIFPESGWIRRRSG